MKDFDYKLYETEIVDHVLNDPALALLLAEIVRYGNSHGERHTANHLYNMVEDAIRELEQKLSEDMQDGGHSD